MPWLPPEFAVQTFSFKIAKLTDRVTVEVDRRWARATGAKGQVHVDFNLVSSIHYWVTNSRGGAALTGHLVVRDSQGRKLALQCSGFGVDKDFVELLRTSSAMLAAIGEAQPSLRVAPEPTAFHRRLMTGVILGALIVVGGATIVFGVEDDIATRAAGVGVGAMIALGFVLFNWGPLRKKPQAVAPAELAQAIAAQVPALPTAP